jgi:hypothetical protein
MKIKELKIKNDDGELRLAYDSTPDMEEMFGIYMNATFREDCMWFSEKEFIEMFKWMERIKINLDEAS